MPRPRRLPYCRLCLQNKCIPECDEDTLSDGEVRYLSLRLMVGAGDSEWPMARIVEEVESA